ncbi:hypothetical protein GTP38_11280 [Duganella sp. FT94W]|uniref:Sel1 repeat family protein n=1 Tax=Duganella lactea TaxID=2692173 RepID=A0ABW9V820_9BURK|nr:hypothetical protein [Duganella lactea]MYM34920.1 hypothetical protein [Duganella lactea]
MQKRGYTTPTEYFTMSLRELSERAKNKDVFALLQLGEQYWKESDELADDPAFDRSVSPVENARKYMSDAVAQGHSRAATIVSAMYEEQGQELEAYAWTLVSQSVMDRSLSEKATSYEQKFTKQQRDAAEEIASKEYAKIVKEMLTRFKVT